MNRGSPVSNWSATGESACFNEAPIHESGKSANDERAERDAWRFNEAPIHESGKFRMLIT